MVLPATTRPCTPSLPRPPGPPTGLAGLIAWIRAPCRIDAHHRAGIQQPVAGQAVSQVVPQLSSVSRISSSMTGPDSTMVTSRSNSESAVGVPGITDV